MMKELPNEIWSKIISFLVRDIPEPRSCKHWFGLHQDDLCSMMRVNSVSLHPSDAVCTHAGQQIYHDLTAPHLYTKAVVPCITAFMRNIETTEVFGKKLEIKIIKEGIMTKKDLLAHVRELHLVYYPFVFEPTYAKLLKDKAEWQDIGVTDEEQLKRELDNCMFARAGELAGKITIRNDILAAANDFHPFPNLETVIVGANGDTSWEQREAQVVGPNDLAGQLLRQQMFQAKSLLLAIMIAGKPKNICIHTLFGPCAPPTDIIFSPKDPIPLESITVHLDDILCDPDSLESPLPPIICGVLNCWMYRFPTTRFNLADWEGDGMLADWLDLFAMHLNELYEQWSNEKPLDGGKAINLDDTRLQIVGCGNCSSTAHRLLAANPGIDFKGDREALSDAFDRLLDEDEAVLAKVQTYLDSKLCTAWKGKVELEINQSWDVCTVCGDRASNKCSVFT